MSSNTGCARSVFRQSSLWAGAIAVLLVISSLAYAQDSSTGNVSGTVTGPRGASVSGADLTITNKITGQSAQTTTSPAGTYAVRDLPPGEYVLHVEAKGFQPADLLIRIQAAATATGDVKLAARGRSGRQAGRYRNSGSARRGRQRPDGTDSHRSRVSGSDPARTRSAVARRPGAGAFQERT